MMMMMMMTREEEKEERERDIYVVTLSLVQGANAEKGNNREFHP